MPEVTCDCCDGMLYRECIGNTCLGSCPVTSGNGGGCVVCDGSGVVPCEYCTEGKICSRCREPVEIRTVETGDPRKLIFKAYGCPRCDWVRLTFPIEKEEC